MHPRNPYTRGPDFKALSSVYPPLASFLRDCTLDFHDERAQRALTQALLQRDFNLQVDLPSDRLCPPVPNRLNYVLWIQDIVSALRRQVKEKLSVEQEDQQIGVCGIDIGTGASAIYPLLAASLEKEWRFVATELDSHSYDYARKNVERNHLQDRIHVVRVNRDQSSTCDSFPTNSDTPFEFDELFRSSPRSIPRFTSSPSFGQDHADSPRNGASSPPAMEIQFTMCNPPFYSSVEDVTASSGAKEGGAFGVCTGAPIEMITPGGEAHFVRSMVRESVRLDRNNHPEGEPSRGEEESDRRPTKRRKMTTGVEEPVALQKSMMVRWHTSMLGKLSSVGEVVAEIRHLGISNYAITEFVQGQTRRWAVGWSLDHYRLPDELSRLTKPNPTLQPLMPPHNTLRCTLPVVPSQTPQNPEEYLDRVHEILTQIPGLLVSRTPEPFPDFSLPSSPPSPKSRSTVIVRAAADTWSRAARRRPARANSQLPQHPEGGPSAIHMKSDGLGNSALMCSMWVEGSELVSRRLYGKERALYESFVSHVGKKVAGVGKSGQVVCSEGGSRV